MKKEAESIMQKREKKYGDDPQKDFHKRNNRKLAFSAVGTPDYVAP